MLSDKKKCRRTGGSQTAGPRPQAPVRTATPPTPPVPPVRPQQTYSQNGGNGEGTQEKKKRIRGVIIISLIFAFLVCGIFYYFYDSANKNKELEAYEYAMQSSTTRWFCGVT